MNANTSHEQHYSDGSFWQKIGQIARSASREVVEKALLLYYAAQDPSTPAWARTAIFGALGYLILPLDAIPDVIPGIGFTDDLGVLVAALALVATRITPAVREKARQRMQRWFGDV